MTDEHDKLRAETERLRSAVNPQFRETREGHIFAHFDRLHAALDRLRTELAEREKFKTYVHERLDAAGVPHDPDPEKTAETGCRVGRRLDWLLAERDASPRPAVPEGWKLVPVKPTPEMLHAAAQRRYVWEKGGTAGPMDAIAYYNVSVRPTSDYMEQGFMEEWKFALTAAPTPPKKAHKWDRGGERCVRCGQKDWMAGECVPPSDASGDGREAGR